MYHPQISKPKVQVLRGRIGPTGLRRCLELQVSFRKRATNYRDFLRKMTCKDKASYGSWPPCATHVKTHHAYGVASISRLLQIIGLFRRIQSLYKGSFAEEIYNLKEPTNRSHACAELNNKMSASTLTKFRFCGDLTNEVLCK